MLVRRKAQKLQSYRSQKSEHISRRKPKIQNKQDRQAHSIPLHLNQFGLKAGICDEGCKKEEIIKKKKEKKREASPRYQIKTFPAPLSPIQ
jgi:hypothetical protein